MFRALLVHNQGAHSFVKQQLFLLDSILQMTFGVHRKSQSFLSLPSSYAQMSTWAPTMLTNNLSLCHLLKARALDWHPY